MGTSRTACGPAAAAHDVFSTTRPPLPIRGRGSVRAFRFTFATFLTCQMGAMEFDRIREYQRFGARSAVFWVT